MNKLRCGMIVLSALALAGAVSPIYAGGYDINIGGSMTLNTDGSSLGSNGGGEFAVTGTFSGGGAITPFRTFCAELGEFFTPGSTYTVANIATSNSTGKTLTSIAAWAYTQFRAGTLAGYTADGTSQSTLQNLIWTELGYSPATTNVNYTLKDSWVTAYNAAVSGGSWPSGLGQYGNVRIAQLTSFGGTVHNQDQLILIPEAGSVAIWSLFGVGLVGVWYKRRK